MSDNNEAEYGEVFEDGVFNAKEEENHIAQALSGSIDELQSDENIEMFSDLSMREIKLISPLLTTKDKTSRGLVHWYLKTNVSRRRKGRKEIIDAIKSIGGLSAQEKQQGRLEKIKDRLI